MKFPKLPVMQCDSEGWTKEYKAKLRKNGYE